MMTSALIIWEAILFDGNRIYSIGGYNADQDLIIVIAIGDDYRFAFFGLVTKLWLKFQGLFY